MTSPRTPSRSALLIAGGTVLYVVIGWLSLRLAFTEVNASAVWPLAGLSMAVLARYGRRYGLAVFLGSFVTNYLVNIENADAFRPAFLAALGIAVGNTLEAFVGAGLIRRALGRPPRWRSAMAVFRFVAAGAFVPPALSAACGGCSLWANGLLPVTLLARTSLVWFTGNAAGTVCFAPLVLIGHWQFVKRRWTWPAIIEHSVLLLLLAFVGQTICGWYFPEIWPGLPKSYMAIPLVLWIAYRFGRHETMIAVLLLLAVCIAGMLRGYAAFPADTPEQSLLSLQLFITIIALVGHTVAATTDQMHLHQEVLEQAVWEKSYRLAAVAYEKATITASAIHDLQSPLSGMRNLLGLARGNREVLAGEPGAALLAEMESAVERMLTLVGVALETEKSTAETLADDGEVICDLAKLLDRVVKTETAHAETKGIRLRQQLLPEDPGKMLINCHAFEHIVGNFVSNAVKFSPFGSTVSITLTRADRTLQVTVEDEGPGIPPEETRELFSGRRYHGSARPTAGETGSGLGLYLTYRLAERIGAELAYEPSPNGGSIFSVAIDRNE